MEHQALLPVCYNFFFFFFLIPKDVPNARAACYLRLCWLQKCDFFQKAPSGSLLNPAAAPPSAVITHLYFVAWWVRTNPSQQSCWGSPGSTVSLCCILVPQQMLPCRVTLCPELRSQLKGINSEKELTPRALLCPASHLM